MHKHLFIFVYSTQKPVSNYNKNAAPIAVTVLVIMFTSNVIKFYMLMSLLRMFKDNENKIGKITYTEFKKYTVYIGVPLKSCTNLQQTYMYD